MLEQLETAGGIVGDDRSRRDGRAPPPPTPRGPARRRRRSAPASRPARPARERPAAALRARRAPARPRQRAPRRVAPARGASSAGFWDDGRAQPLEQIRAAFAPHLDALARAAQAVESAGGALAPAGHRGQLLLGALAFGEQASSRDSTSACTASSSTTGARLPRLARTPAPRGRATRARHGCGGSPRRASPRARRRSPGARAAAAASAPLARDRAHAPPAARLARASAPRGGGGA